MSKKQALIGFILAFVIAFTACKDDVANTGESVLTPEDEVVVLADTFAFRSAVDSCRAIIS